MKISVCMATYNGERFIHEQLASILGQLKDGDEVVIVDDASTDSTLAIVESFGDERIRIIRQPQNRGVLQTFNRALDEASGDIVFLSDQDDVWRTDKVMKIKDVFSNRPDVSLVISDSRIIDGRGGIIAETRFASRKFRPGAWQNFLRNRYLGCAMAFRRSVLEYCLPFPADVPQHDMWIGIVNQLIGKTEFIDEPLMSYRRHERNISPHQKHAPLAQMIRWRWALGKNLALFWARTMVWRKRNVAIPGQ
jgi:glycosyltransferase involved in cell wall biosynthesis